MPEFVCIYIKLNVLFNTRHETFHLKIYSIEITNSSIRRTQYVDLFNE